MNKSIKIALGALALIFSISSQAIPARSTPLPGTQIGVAYMIPGSNSIYGKNTGTFMQPASTLKVLTALSAVLYLGQDYTLKTALEVPPQNLNQNGTLKLSEGGVLNGNVVVKFTGDPSFKSKDYATLISSLKNLGVKRISGSVILDLSRFGGLSRGQGWSWNDLPICFTAPAGAAIINRNCAFAQLQPHGEGKVATALVPSSVPIGINSEAYGIKSSEYGINCELEANLYRNNQYRISGCVPIQKQNKPWPLSLAVSDPEQWAVDWTNIIFKNHGIHINGIKISHESINNYATLGYIESKPLKELLKYMLYRSNNLYADAIAKNVAYEYYKLPATYQRTTAAIRSILAKYANIDLGNAYFVDGSGLSPHNIVSPEIMLEVLQYINLNDDKLHFIELLPVAGVSGSLHWRASTSQPPLAKNVTAKTGTLQNVSNLMGFIKTKSGHRVPFVMYTGALNYDLRTRDMVKYRRMASPHLGYERYVLEQIYNEKVMGRDFN